MFLNIGMSGPLPISCMPNYKLIECAYARRVFPIALRGFRDLQRVDYAFRARALDTGYVQA